MLLRGGVPFHIAFHGVETLHDDERFALAIVLLELDGARFNWDRMEWVENK
jgi:hypothetical protein